MMAMRAGGVAVGVGVDGEVDVEAVDGVVGAMEVGGADKIAAVEKAESLHASDE